MLLSIIIIFVPNFVGKTIKNGSMCIFIHETLQFTTIDLNEFFKEQDFEVCAVKLHFSFTSFYLIYL